MTMIQRIDPNMGEADYHSDPCAAPSLSASIANVIDRQSMAHAYAAHPRLGGIKRAPTKSMDHGALIHKLLLGKGAEIVSVSADDWRTKVAQEAKREARTAGKVPVLQADHEAAWDAAGMLRKRFVSLGLELGGHSEVSLFWQASSSAGPVQCRGRMDHFTETKHSAQILDLKSCISAHPEACARHIDSYGYTIQRAAYVSGVERLRPAIAGNIDFVFVFMELKAPYVVTPVRLSGVFAELGERRWNRAVEYWGRALKDNRWPAYTDGIMTLDPMQWALMKDIDRTAAEEAA